MKNTQDQSQYERQFNVYQQRVTKSPKNHSQYYNDFEQNNNGPIISKLQINFPQMKICQSRKDITQQSLDFSMTSEFRAALLKQQNYTPTKNFIDKNNFSPFAQYKKQQRHRSPVRFNENSYSCQETTKQDYDQNNTSYHDFFKVPQNLTLNQHNKSTKAFPGTYQQFDTVNEDLYKKEQYGYSTPKKNENVDYLFQAKTQTINYERFNFSPQYKLQEKFSRTQQKPKLKDNMTLSQLLSDLQHRSQKLYQMYGENNEDYQKCVDKIQQTQKDFYVNPLNQKQTYQTKSKPYFQNNQIGNFNHFQNFKFLDQNSPHFNNQKVDNQLLAKNEEKLYSEKSMLSSLGQSTKIDKKKKKVSFQSSQLNSKDINFQSISREKASTNFYFQDDKQQTRMKIKISKVPAFMNKLKRFFTMHLLKILKPKFYYQTGLLSTQSNIQFTNRKIQAVDHSKFDRLHDKSKQQKDISFFQQYFKQQGKFQDYVIAYGVEKKSQKNLMKKKSRESKNYLQINDLPLIEEQLQSEYGASMRKSPQRAKSPVISKLQSQKFSQVRKQKDSKLKEFMNTNQNVKMGQLLIQSVNKEVFEYCLNPKNYKLPKRDGKLIGNVFKKIQQVMRYKILTLLRHIFLMIKFHDFKENDKSAGIFSLKISSASLKQRYHPIGLDQQQNKIKVAKKNEEQSYKGTQHFVEPPNDNRQISYESKRQTSEEYHHEPKNILQHYYKKVSSLDSQTNEYASILNSQNQIALNNKFYQESQKRIKTENSERITQDELRKSRFNPALTLKVNDPTVNLQKQQYLAARKSLENSNTQNNPSQIYSATHGVVKYATTNDSPILQQEYYAIQHQEGQSKIIQRNRLSRAVSCSNMKINEGLLISGGNEGILKPSQINLKQSKIYQSSKIIQKVQDYTYGMNINNLPVQKSSRILPGKILPQGHTRLDMYNKTGKISRSYSENDFQYYYQHNTQNINGNQQQQLRVSNNFQQQESKNYNNMQPNPLRVSKNVMNTYNMPPQQQNMRKSSVQSAGPSMNQNLRMSNTGISSSILKNNQQLRQSQMMSQQQRMRSSKNSKIKPNIPPTTVRPLINASIQKKRCYSVGSFLNGPSLIHGLNGLSSQNSAIKQLQAMPFIQQKNTIPSSSYNNNIQLKTSQTKMYQNQQIFIQNNPFVNHYYQQQPQNMQLNNHQRAVPLNNLINPSIHMQNRPRMSKSMDNFVMRPVSYSGFNKLNISPSPIMVSNNINNQPGRFIHQPNVTNSFQTIPNFTNPQNYPITNQPILKNPACHHNLPIKIPNRQLQVDSEYHMLKLNNTVDSNNFNLASNNIQNHINANQNSIPGQQIKRQIVNNNGSLRKNTQKSGRGSRIMYQQQNLIMNPIVKPNVSPQNQINSPYHTKPTSPRNVIYSAKSNQHKQMVSPSMKSSATGFIPRQQNFNGIKSSVGSQPQVKLQSLTINSGRPIQQYTQPTSVPQNNLKISKSRSPQLPIKTKSPQILHKQNTKPNLNTIKSQRLGSYGQY